MLREHPGAPGYREEHRAGVEAGEGVGLTFPPVAESVGAARAIVRRILAARGARSWPVEVAVSELVTNAVEHARTTVRLDVTVSDRVYVAVSDTEPAMAWADGDQSLDRIRGRGLQIVEALALRWGIEHHNGGKTIWAEFALPPRPAA